MDQELKQYLDAMKREVLETVYNSKREVLDHTEAVETRLLGEFWKWARTADARYRQSHAVVGALDDRVQAIEDRVADLERRKAS